MPALLSSPLPHTAFLCFYIPVKLAEGTFDRRIDFNIYDEILPHMNLFDIYNNPPTKDRYLMLVRQFNKRYVDKRDSSSSEYSSYYSSEEEQSKSERA